MNHSQYAPNPNLDPQHGRNLTISTDLGPNVFIISACMGNESLSRPFVFGLDLISHRDDLKFGQVIGKKATVSIRLESGRIRYINGVISEFGIGDKISNPTWDAYSSYHATLSPRVLVLNRNSDCRIFHTMSVPDIVKKILDENGIPYISNLNSTYPRWEYCVQYNETDLHFISRLLEMEGIYYYFKHEQDRHTIVFVDNLSLHDECPLQPVASFESKTAVTSKDNLITSFDPRRTIGYNTYTIQDYNFKTPDSNLESTVSGKNKLEESRKESHYYGAGHEEMQAGENKAKIFMEEAECRSFVYHGTSHCRGLESGFYFTLENYFPLEMNGKYLVTSINHSVSQPYGEFETFSYKNNFSCIPLRIQYRPPRATGKPRIPGTQTAFVIGPEDSGEEIYTDADGYGMVKVRFHWDHRNDGSRWIRVSQPWAGSGFGFAWLPRVGHEVIVDFIDGDPDRPIVTGSVYHANNRPPLALPGEKTMSTIKSNSSKGGGGYNELRFEDKKGGEEIYIHAQKDWKADILNNKIETIGEYLEITCGASKITMKKDGTITITGKDITYKASGTMILTGAEVKIN